MKPRFSVRLLLIAMAVVSLVLGATATWLVEDYRRLQREIRERYSVGPVSEAIRLRIRAGRTVATWDDLDPLILQLDASAQLKVIHEAVSVDFDQIDRLMTGQVDIAPEVLIRAAGRREQSLILSDHERAANQLIADAIDAWLQKQGRQVK